MPGQRQEGRKEGKIASIRRQEAETGERSGTGREEDKGGGHGQGEGWEKGSDTGGRESSRSSESKGGCVGLRALTVGASCSGV